MQPLDFYIVPEDIYRLGNVGGPRLSNVRARDVDTTEINGVTVVVANGKGISVFDIDGIQALSDDGLGVEVLSNHFHAPRAETCAR